MPENYRHPELRNCIYTYACLQHRHTLLESYHIICIVNIYKKIVTRVKCIPQRQITTLKP